MTACLDESVLLCDVIVWEPGWVPLSAPRLPAVHPLNVRVSLSQLYGSAVAASVLCQAVSQVAITRAVLCRDLLILQQLYLRLGDNVSISRGLGRVSPCQCGHWPGAPWKCGSSLQSKS